MRKPPYNSLSALTLSLALGVSMFLAASSAQAQKSSPRSTPPTFYKDVLPILQNHCQSCHRVGEIAPMPLTNYTQARLYAAKIAAMARTRQMPPWFADPRYGQFSNDPSLTSAQIATLVSWAADGAPAGNPHDAPPPRHWATGWVIPQPDDVVTMPKPVTIPAHGDVEYTYEIVPTGFQHGKWVQMCEIRPSSRPNVHHAVVYVRPPNSKWLAHAPIGVPFTASSLKDPQDRRDAEWTDSQVLLVYAPGSSPDEWPASMAKFIPAGSDLVFQVHYTTKGVPAVDQTSVGLVFSKHPPKYRILTLQLTNDTFIIPPDIPDFRVEVHGTIPNDCLLLSLFPHMHLRGKQFEYNIVHRDGRIQTLLLVHYNFMWQMTYRLAHPFFLKAGTELQAVAWYDNSPNNPHNPNPTVAVRWGDQTTDEMMIGFFDVAVPPGIDKWRFFIRHPRAAK